MTSISLLRPAVDFKNKNVVVYGLGVSGLSATKLLHYLEADVKVVNKGPASNWKNWPHIADLIKLTSCFDEKDSSSHFAQAELIILSPGISLENPFLQEAIKNQVPIWSEIELGYYFADIPIIAVTGTNGKTTTVTLLAEMFQRSSKVAFVGGNIGTPFCQYALDKLLNEANGKKSASAPYDSYDYIVLEISSFQLETIHYFRPHVAVITNITQGHEERYLRFEDYAAAKFKITKNMKDSDYIIYPDGIPIIHDWIQKQKVRTIPFNKEKVLAKFLTEFDLSSFTLKGWHNWENLFCAISAFQMVCDQDENHDQDLGQDHAAIQQTITEFPGVPHRLERVKADKNYAVYNDAKSTNLEATVTAINSLWVSQVDVDTDDDDSDNTEIKGLYLIFGGKVRDKVQHQKGLAESVLIWQKIFTKVRKIFLIGESTDSLSQFFKNHLSLLGITKEQIVVSYDLEHVMKHMDLNENNFINGTLLFSPGYPSFDQFENYEHRGNYFKSLFKI